MGLKSCLGSTFGHRKTPFKETRSMARAHRYYLPGHIYHPSSHKASPDKSNPSGFDPTGRCHKREFLLKFRKDREHWLDLLFEAKKRFGLIINA
jgi:putative transposase